MSIKTQIFRTAVQHPLTAKDVMILIPQIPMTTITVQSTTFPTEKFKSCIIKRRGQDVELPTKMQVDGDWSFSVPDDIFTSMRYNLLKVMYKRKLFDVYQILGSLDINTNSLSSLLNALGNASSVLLTAQVLNECWIRQIAPIEFSSSDPTRPVTWQVTIHYNYITPLLGVL